jgi:hypothetical protein
MLSLKPCITIASELRCSPMSAENHIEGSVHCRGGKKVRSPGPNVRNTRCQVSRPSAGLTLLKPMNCAWPEGRHGGGRWPNQAYAQARIIANLVGGKHGYPPELGTGR